MKKLSNRFLVFTMAFALICSMSISSMAVYASESTAVAEEVTINMAEVEAGTEIQPRKNYYPVSGASSGAFSGSFSNYAIYNNLPATSIRISYAIDSPGPCYLQFYQNTSLIKNTSAISGNGETRITLPFAGQYTVRLYYPDGNSSTEVIYGFNLYD